MKVAFHGTAPPTSREFETNLESSWHIPEEVPVAFVYNRRNYAIMMATPDDAVDFAVGFSLTERVVNAASDIKAIDIYQSDKGLDLRLSISDRAVEKLDIIQRRRNLVGRASCGICGLENAEMLFSKLPKVSDEPVLLDMKALEHALKSLRQNQPLNQKTKTVHAAAWADASGNISLTREDVGRHNALDKLLGAMARNNYRPEDGFAVMSSRCSYEIVEKAANCGVRAIVSISAPTAFALRKANEANMAIYCQSANGVVRLL